MMKFPLLSRSGRLNRIVFDTSDTDELDHIKLDEIPGGAEAFELAAKFCYGVSVDLSASNISSLRCAAEYLEMTEDLEEGNLIFKTEAFLSYVVLSSWRDSIIVLKSCENLSPWAENLQIVRRCSESIAWKACANPRGIRWAYTGSKSHAKKAQSPHWNDIQDTSPGRGQQPPPDWWFEDVSILRIDHFVRVITAIKVKGMRFDLIGASIMHYASKWLPGISSKLDQSAPNEDNNNVIGNNWIKSGGLHMVVAGAGKEDSVPNMQIREQRMIVESLISIIPPQKDTVSCSFLLRLLRLANMLKVAPALVTELEKRVGMQFEQANVNDLLIPSYNKSETLYDVDLLQRLLEHFLIHEQSEPASPSRPASGEKRGHGAAAPSAKMRVARLVDSYLTEVARDRNLSLTKFQVLAEALPESARTCDDGLYRAIDSYLKVKISNAIASNGSSIAKDQTESNFLQYPQAARNSVLENLPQSFQEGWSTAKKDINTIKFDVENMKAKFLELQTDFDNLQHQFEKLSKQKSGSAWSTGWKKLSKLKHSTLFHNKLSVYDSQDMGSTVANGAPQVQKPARRWRNSIS